MEITSNETYYGIEYVYLVNAPLGSAESGKQDNIQL